MTNYKSYTLHNFREIPQVLRLPEELTEAIGIVGKVLPFKTNNYVVENLINWDNVPDDPMFTLTFPRKEMLPKAAYVKLKRLLDENCPQEVVDAEIRKIRLHLNPNPAGQEFNVPMLGEVKLKGVQHKYRETVLFSPRRDKPVMLTAHSVFAGLNFRE